MADVKHKTKTQVAGDFLAFVGIVGLPLLISFAIYMTRKKK